MIKKDSHNSSKPPSIDFKRLVPKSLRKKGKRKSGGQPGHQGFTLRQVANPDKRIFHSASGKCPCGEDIRNGEQLDDERRQTADIPPPQKLEYTEHCAERFKCKCGRIHTAPFPQGVGAPIQYGARIRALQTYLSIYQLLPQKRCIELLNDVFGVQLSEGTLNNTLQLAHRNLATTEGANKRCPP